MEDNNIPTENFVAEIELIYKPRMKISHLPKVLDSKDAYHYFENTWDKAKLQFVEQFKVMLINRANRVLGICTLSTGGLTGTIIDLRLVFASALKANACYIIIAHNHPSGNLNPSQSDVVITHRVKEAGKLLDLGLRDHIIISEQGYYSFSDEGAI